MKYSVICFLSITPSSIMRNASVGDPRPLLTIATTPGTRYIQASENMFSLTEPREIVCVVFASDVSVNFCQAKITPKLERCVAMVVGSKLSSEAV